jgi:hypothetical protein
VVEDRDPCLRCGDLLREEDARVQGIDLCRRCVDDEVVLRVDASPALVTILAVSLGLVVGMGAYARLGLHAAVGLGILTMFAVGVAIGLCIERRAKRLLRELEDQYFDGLPAAPVVNLRGRGLLGGSDRGFLLIGDGYVFLGVRGTRLAVEPRCIQEVAAPQTLSGSWSRLVISLVGGNRLVVDADPTRAAAFHGHAQLLRDQDGPTFQ